MKKCLIIAEVGVNHNGNLEIAKKLVDMAYEAGADIVKFQTANLNSLVTKNAPMAEYQKENMQVSLSQVDMLKKLLLSYDDFKELSKYCQKIGIQFLSTPFDIESIEFLYNMGCKIWKIPSGEITNLPYLERIAKTHQPVILSTGMSTIEEIRAAIDVLKNNSSGAITLLHCTTAYPAPYDDINLRAMQTLRDEFNCEVGYSDHTMGYEIAIAAVALGANVIEKHFTLDRNMIGPDHKASLEPEELKRMIFAIRHVEKALGSSKKRPSLSEVGNMQIVRKSIVAKRDILKGEILSTENITTKRPGSGISPMRWYEVIGTLATRDFKEDDLIEL